jgi:hypothetical protein
MSKPPRKVREPVQVYLDPTDKELLDQLSASTSLPRAELLRRGLRRLATELNAEAEPGRSLSSLIGALGDSADIPSDLSQRHDEYLYPNPDADATGFD